ncbi:MAG: ABC transporter substrate-binding protein [Desulfobacteraceae bacterium]|nr:ABC transporter substrate-binding protein [Desulfobacteraceae bacterium]
MAGQWPVVSNPKGLATRFPQQLELDPYEKYQGTWLDFHENPLFAEQVKKGLLPPVEQRLPADPLVVLPYGEIGRYGGTLRGIALAYESGTAEILSWRQTNLVRFNDDARTIVPNVAKAWKWDEDYAGITFFLRKGHRWSDGAPFTADDVVFWFNDIIMNREIHPEVPAPWGDLDAKIEKIDAATVKWTFNKPYTTLLYYLGGVGSYYAPYAPMHFLKAFHSSYNPKANETAVKKGFKNWTQLFRQYWSKWTDSVVRRPAGLRVPTLESHILNEEPTPASRKFIANPYYFKVDTAGNQLPYIDYHHERFLKRKEWAGEIINGNVDQKSQNLPLDLYPELKKSQKNGNFIVQLPQTGAGPAIIFNKTHKDPVLREIFLDARFNHAMSLAINRDELNQKLFLGLCKPRQALPQNTRFITRADKKFMAGYAPDRANALLDGMGLKRGGNGIRIRKDGLPLGITWEYTLQYVWSHEFPKLVAGYWRDIGIQVDLKEVTTGETRKKQQNNTLDITSEWMSPFEPTLFATPETFMPPYATVHPIMGRPWMEWKNSHGVSGIQPPEWVLGLWELGRDFVSTIPGTDWYDAVGREIVRINLENLTIIGTLGEVPLVTIVSTRLANTPAWKINSFYYGYAYPYRADQWYFK